MTTKIILSYEKPGFISNEKLQQALDRFDLGKLIKAEPIPRGSGQNIFVSSSAGEFVFRGKPMFYGQFLEEKFIAEHLMGKRTYRL